MAGFTIIPNGPFSLAAARDVAGGFAAGIGAHQTEAGILMAFPAEDWSGGAAVDVWQSADGAVHGVTYGDAPLEVVERQAARSLSLDHDAAEWAAVSERDHVIAGLQVRYPGFRPVCFYSAYEAATSFVIGQRIAMRQARVIKERLSAGWGDVIEIEGGTVMAFPRPQRLLEVTAVAGLSATKVARLRAIAQAAVEGRLDTERLRAMPTVDALEALQALPGIGAWTAEAVLMRGCGTADTLPLSDGISRRAVAWFYDLAGPPDDETWIRLAEPWRPFRMWATVLLHMAWRRDQAAPPSYRQGA